MKIMTKNPIKFISMLFIVTVCIAFTVVSACMGAWERAAILLLATVIILVSSFAARDIIPLKYNDNVIRYRKSEYRWQNVKVTLVYTHRLFHSSHFVYYLVFGDSFVFGDEVRGSVNKGFWVELTLKNLDTITKYYHDRIAVVGKDGASISVDKLLIDKRFKLKINEHNAKHFDGLKETDDIKQ